MTEEATSRQAQPAPIGRQIVALSCVVSMFGLYITTVAGWLLGYKAWAVLFVSFYVLTGLTSYLGTTRPKEANIVLYFLFITPALTLWYSAVSLFNRLVGRPGTRWWG
jgi:hypothetical protein